MSFLETPRARSARPCSKRRYETSIGEVQMTTTISKPRETVTGTTCGGTTLPFDGIHEPGAYICRWSGHLLRVPEDSISSEHTPRMGVIGADALLVTKIDRKSTRLN